MYQNQSTPVDLMEALAPLSSLMKQENPALTPQAFAKWMESYDKIKSAIDEKAAEVSVKQDQIRFVNSIICELNSLVDDKEGLDLTTQEGLLEKMERAVKDLGITLPLNKKQFSPLEFTRLIQNLNLAIDGWDKENKTNMQKIETQSKILDRMMMILKSIEKAESQAITAGARGIKGG